MPAKVEGTWTIAQGDLVLKQQFQMVSGTFGGKPITDGRLRGDELKFTVGGTQYTGKVSGNNDPGLPLDGHKEVGADFSRPIPLITIVLRAVVGALIGALIASAALTLATLLDPSILIDFDSDLPRPIASGFYGSESTPQETYAWTAALATVTFRGIDRRVAWRCSIRMRGAHPADLPQPAAALGIDGITVRTEPAGPEFRELAIDAPVSSRASSLSITILTTPTFVPGTADKRELGVQVDSIRCVPASDERASAPSSALFAAACAGAAFGALFAVLGSMTMAAGLAILLSGALAFVISRGMAAYSPAYLDWIVPVALWISIPVLAFAGPAILATAAGSPGGGLRARLFVHGPVPEDPRTASPVERCRGRSVPRASARCRSGRQLLLHTADARGVRFPYAIGLYVTASPWARLIPDHVALLRIVVCVFEALAAALLYFAIARAWKDHLTGACAVVLYHAAPLPYVIVGNANLTFAFAQSISVLTLVAATVLTFGRRWLLSASALMLVAALAFLSHVGVFPVLALSLGSLGVLYLWRWGSDVRVAGWCVLGATAIAAVLAVGVYYARFPEVWSTLDRVRSPIAAAPEQGTPEAAGDRGPAPLSFAERATRAATHGRDAYAVPLLMLAIPGLWLVWRGPRDRLTLGLAAWGIGFAAFLAFRIIAPVDARLQRYADEFIDRLYYITLPVIAVLAARAAAAAWRIGGLARWASVALVLAAAVLAAAQWSAWTA